MTDIRRSCRFCGASNFAHVKTCVACKTTRWNDPDDTKLGLERNDPALSECPGPECPACNGDTCWKCPVGTSCEHDVVERHQRET